MSDVLGGGGGFGDKGLRLPLWETLRLAWADEELRGRLLFVLLMFGVFALGVNIPVPIPGVSAKEAIDAMMERIPFLELLNLFGGGALKKVSIFALGLNPYITASIIIQILTASIPAWKKDLQEGGEYARRQQNKKTRGLTLLLCLFQGYGLLALIQQAITLTPFAQVIIILFWTAGAMFMLWLGEQITEKGIGNGVSLMIFAGIIISLPSQFQAVGTQLQSGIVQWWQLVFLALLFIAVTWFVVMFTIAQRRIPIQHMRRQVGTRTVGGATNYLPLSLNLAGVIPIIFAVSLIYMPSQFSAMFPPNTPGHDILQGIGNFLYPAFTFPNGLIGCIVYTLLIFFFTYFYTAIQYNVEDISNQLKRVGSFIPGVRPGKQTRDFLDGVISRITIVGASFLALVALLQYLAPAITGIQQVGYFFGTSLLIMVSVALETMRQIEANILMKQYGN